MSRTVYAVLSLITFAIGFVALGVNADESTTALPPRTIPSGDTTAPSQMAISLPSQQRLSEFGIATRLVGIARPSQLADLRAPVSGPIVEVLVRTGDRVKAGDVLVRLDDRVQQAAVNVAQVEAARVGSLSLAGIELQLAEKQLQRVARAFQRQAGSQFEVDEKTSARDQARAKVTIEQETQARARANLDRTLAELNEYSIRAPFDGEVVQVHQKAGGTVDRSTAVITIADRKKLNVELNLPLDEFGTITQDSELLVRADAPVERTLQARVISVSPYVNSASRTFRVELEIENSDEQLPSGFTVRQQSATSSSGMADRTRPQQSRRK